MIQMINIKILIYSVYIFYPAKGNKVGPWNPFCLSQSFFSNWQLTCPSTCNEQRSFVHNFYLDYLNFFKT